MITDNTAPAGDGARRETLAAGAIIDVMTGGKFDWRSRIDDDEFLESGDWATALAYARAASAALSTQATDREKVLEEAASGLLELVEAIQRNNPALFIPSLNFNGKVTAARRALAQAPSADQAKGAQT